MVFVLFCFVLFDNRFESTHGRLKKMIQDSTRDLCRCWDAMNNMIILQHIEIKTSFEKSVILEHIFNTRFYISLNGFVSRSVLNHIADEFERAKIDGINSAICGCTIRRTHGLPRACELAKYVRWVTLFLCIQFNLIGRG